MNGSGGEYQRLFEHLREAAKCGDQLTAMPITQVDALIDGLPAGSADEEAVMEWDLQCPGSFLAGCRMAGRGGWLRSAASGVPAVD